MTNFHDCHLVRVAQIKELNKAAELFPSEGTQLLLAGDFNFANDFLAKDGVVQHEVMGLDLLRLLTAPELAKMPFVPGNWGDSYELVSRCLQCGHDFCLDAARHMSDMQPFSSEYPVSIDS